MADEMATYTLSGKLVFRAWDMDDALQRLAHYWLSLSIGESANLAEVGTDIEMTGDSEGSGRIKLVLRDAE